MDKHDMMFGVKFTRSPMPPSPRSKAFARLAPDPPDRSCGVGPSHVCQRGRPRCDRDLGERETVRGSDGEIALAAGDLEFYAGEAERARRCDPAPPTPPTETWPSRNPSASSYAWYRGIPCRYDYTEGWRGDRVAGCTTVVKPASGPALTVLALAYLADQAGLPAGV